MSNQNDNPYRPPSIPADDQIPSGQDEKLICVATFPDALVARMARDELQEAGISACLGDETTNTMLWHIGGALGGVKLLVFASQAEKAKTILEADNALDVDADFGDTKTDDEIEDADRDDDRDEEVLPTQIQRSGHIRRAWYAAILGLCICPPLLNMYSLYIILGENLLWPEAKAKPDWRLPAALLIDILALTAAVALWYLLFWAR
jgi:hypothetical protein